MTDRYEKTPSPEVQAKANYAHTVPDECETVYWRGQILSMNELAALAQQPASNAPVGVDAIRIADDLESWVNDPFVTFLTPMRKMDVEDFVRRIRALAKQPAAANKPAG